jgi:hypothetical protein
MVEGGLAAMLKVTLMIPGTLVIISVAEKMVAGLEN